MRHRKDGFKLGRLTQHRWAMFRNLLVGLFRHERIQTTEAKAKAVSTAKATDGVKSVNDNLRVGTTR